MPALPDYADTRHVGQSFRPCHAILFLSIVHAQIDVISRSYLCCMYSGMNVNSWHECASGKPSETKRGTRRPENQKASSSCISDTEMKEALAAMLVAAGRFRVGPRTSSPEEKQLWERFDKKPSEFWDIRAKRKTSCSPDFKHKKTLISLWVKNKPDWVSLDAVGHEQQQAVNKSGPAGEHSSYLLHQVI